MCELATCGDLDNLGTQSRTLDGKGPAVERIGQVSTTLSHDSVGSLKYLE